MACPTFSAIPSSATWGAPVVLSTSDLVGFGPLRGRVGLRGSGPGCAEVELAVTSWLSAAITVSLPPDPPAGCSAPFEIVVYTATEPAGCPHAITISGTPPGAALPPFVQPNPLVCEGELLLSSAPVPGSSFGASEGSVRLVDPLAPGMRTTVSRLHSWEDTEIVSNFLPAVQEIQPSVPENALWHLVSVLVTRADGTALPLSAPLPIIIPPPLVTRVTADLRLTPAGVEVRLRIEGNFFGARGRGSGVYWVGDPGLSLPSLAPVDPRTSPPILSAADLEQVTTRVRPGIPLHAELISWSDNEIVVRVPAPSRILDELRRLGRPGSDPSGVIVVTRDDVPGNPFPLPLRLPLPLPAAKLPLARLQIDLRTFHQGGWTQNLEGHPNFLVVSVGAELVAPDPALPRVGNAPAPPPVPGSTGLPVSPTLVQLASGEAAALVPAWVSRDFRVNYLASNSNPIEDLDEGALGEPSFTVIVPASPGVRLTLRVVGVRIGNIADPRVCQELAVLVGSDPQTAPPSAPAGVWQFQYSAQETLPAAERFGMAPGMNRLESTITRGSPSNQALDFTLTVLEVGESLASSGTDVITLDPGNAAGPLGLPAAVLDPSTYFQDNDAETWGSVDAIRASFGLPG